jgi:uncharacterized protein
MATVTAGDFEWDEAKADTNLDKHRVSFEEAAQALLDPYSVDFDDPGNPRRAISLCFNASTGVVYVVWCEGSEERTRIISARKANSDEQRRYQEEHGR